MQYLQESVGRRLVWEYGPDVALRHGARDVDLALDIEHFTSLLQQRPTSNILCVLTGTVGLILVPPQLPPKPSGAERQLMLWIWPPGASRGSGRSG